MQKLIQEIISFVKATQILVNSESGYSSTQGDGDLFLKAFTPEINKMCSGMLESLRMASLHQSPANAKKGEQTKYIKLLLQELDDAEKQCSKALAKLPKAAAGAASGTPTTLSRRTSLADMGGSRGASPVPSVVESSVAGAGTPLGSLHSSFADSTTS